MAQILVVDDEPKMTSLICGTLEDEGHQVTTTVDPSEALKLIDQHSYDIVITDLSMPGVSGMQVLDRALARGDCAVIMMTAFASAETAVEAMKKGAADYLIKPFALDELVIQVKRLTEQQKLGSLNAHYKEAARGNQSKKMIGSSPATVKIRKLIEQVAPTEATVLLTGRSGTGKELAARMIHDLSPRSNQPFIAVNAAALPETLMEAELFGHEKGAFTGAEKRKLGRFELADCGTIFLDEIGEVSPAVQSKLLRVLEERQLMRVGGVDTISVDVRVIVATNSNLKEQIGLGTFREDLYFRLNVFPIELPPLAERGQDVIELAESFLIHQLFPHTSLDPAVTDLLLKYDWPGNIRELRNVLERAVILSGGEPLSLEEFSLEIESDPLISGSTGGVAGTGLESTEKEMILAALEQTGDNKTEAAKLLKITRRRLYSRMKIHGLKP
ncbi:MAG: sigma-54-dependent Fis family transcriptional regulator [candidate division Zixibacteria bacterium]|nr:sigma-54-dependent Fis family transcriptional regulator [candidate division Zixibacteria bacterium]